MVTVPAATPVTTPETESTVALDIDEEVHLPPVVALASVMVCAVQTDVLPVIVAAAVATVTLLVALVNVPDVRHVPVPVHVRVQ